MKSRTGVTDRIRALGRSLDISAQIIADFERRETDAVGPLVELGSHGVQSITLERRVKAVCRQQPDFERAFWFVRGEVFFLEPFLATKQLIKLLLRITQLWTPRLQEEEAIAVRWLAAEAVSLLTLQLSLSAARIGIPWPPNAWCECCAVDRVG
ncbi:hypothetical protein [Streptomyces sp. URMC 129]|uniref:hypothetical protein n=1 Tax=Streptomyces sp. URMC 129 TaxID=3423407 RepID=UPI003F1BA0C9